ncbi:TYRO protein tyrosine kinase-binding protein [Lacerta agilis]|uniref:TYRO protein tyrosine kinase-binding protein n=1 Tax=Lacerta agilis TaxID=80427 RepID=UPI00141A0765|nr:TYRO protein tyrosine kinase-binding protein [Lacerta agilis]
MGRPGFPVLHVLLGLAWAQLGAAQAQRDCGSCYQLNPGTIAGVVLGDLLLTLLIALAVYYVAACIHQRQSAGDLKSPPHESPYEELQIRGVDIYSDLKNPSRGSYK